MSIWDANNLSTLEGFANRRNKSEVSKPVVPDGAGAFFQKLMKKSFGITGQLNKKTALDAFHYLLAEEIPAETKKNSFYEFWLRDMAKISELFCNVAKHNAISV